MTEARFHLPGLRYNYPLNMFWISMLEERPYFFREGVKIASVFGVFPQSMWNGGRLILNDQCDSGFVESVIKNINGKGIPIRYTFNNTIVERSELDDPFCNFCMDAANNGMNEVIVASPLLEDYLRNRYPNYKYNSSTCKEIRTAEQINDELKKDYETVVLDYNMNNQWDQIDKITDMSRLEVLINPVCHPNCKRRGDHYKNVARNQRIIQKNKNMPPDKQIPLEGWQCEYGDHNTIYTIRDYCTFVSAEDIWDKYLPRGICNFKIEGRTAYLFSLIETYCYYMIKPEYVGQARLLLIKNLENMHVISVNKPRPAKWP